MGAFVPVAGLHPLPRTQLGFETSGLLIALVMSNHY